MRNKKSFKRQLSFFQNHLVSYITLIVLIVLTLIPYISNTMLEADKRAEDKLRATVNQTLDNLDATLTNIETMLISNENDAFSALYQLNGNLRTSDYYTMRKASQYIHTIVSSNPTLMELIITYPDSGISLRSEGGFDSIEAFDQYYMRDGFYKEVFLQQPTPHYLSSRSIQYSSTRIREDVFGYCFNMNKSGRIKALIIIRTQEYLGDEMLQSIRGEGYATLTDIRGNTIHEIGEASNSGNSSNILIQCTSQSGRFVFTASLPRTMLPGTSLEIMTLLMMCLLASLGIGGLYAYLSARRHTRPVERLIGELNQYNLQIHANEARMAAMQNVLDGLQEENEHFSEQMENFRQIRHENTVTRLFTSTNLSREDIDYLNEACGTLPERFVVAYGKVGQSAIKEEYPDEMSLIFVNMIRRQLPARCLIYLPDPRSIAVLLGEDMTQERDALVSSFPDVAWSFSRAYHGERFVSSALEEARLTHEFKDRRPLSISMQSIQRIYQCLIAGDIAEVEQQLDEIFSAMDPESIRHIYEGLRFVIYMVAGEQGLSTVVPSFNQRMSREELCDTLREAARTQCREIHSRKKSRNEERKKQVLQFIQDNYTDSSLYAPLIAEQVGISEKYLYNFIKEQTGYSLGDYLLKLRMEKAVELLKQSDLSIKEICYAVGFNSENSFYKAFKRTHGITPSQFRAMSKN